MDKCNKQKNSTKSKKQTNKDNQVNNVQNVHRWLNKIPLPLTHPSTSNAILDKIWFCQNKKVYTMFHISVQPCYIFQGISTHLSLFTCFDTSCPFVTWVTRQGDMPYTQNSQKFCRVRNPAFSAGMMMMQKCISAAGLFPSFLEIPRKIGPARSRCDTAIRHK